MKHLVLAPLFPPIRYGGIEIIAERLCYAMAQTDEVVVIAVKPNGAAIEHRWHRGVEVWEVPGHFFSPLSVDTANSAVLDVARAQVGAADLLHCHDWFLTDAAVTLAKRGWSLVGYFHTVKSLERAHLDERVTPSRRYSEEKQSLLAARSDVVAVYSNFMRETVAAAFDVQFDEIVQFMCGPTLALENSTARRPYPTKGLRFTYMGRLASEKGVDLLVKAFSALWESRPEHELRVIGAGPLAATLFELADRLPCRTRITFEPFINDQASLVQAYRDSNLVVVPSRFEPYGLVAAEALALGVPVAVAEAGGLPEIVKWGDYGEVFPAGSVDGMHATLEVVANDPAASVSRAAQGRKYYADTGLWNEAVDSILTQAVSAGEYGCHRS